MFEHLSPKIRPSAAQKRVRVKLYAWFLLLALFVFISTWGLSQGTASSAQDNPQITAAIYTSDHPTEEQVVLESPRLTVFNFTIKTNSNQVFLRQLKIQAAGVFNEDWLADLRLYQGKTQLGQITNLDDGLLFFDIGSYQLAKGDNNFQLRLTTSDNLSLADAASFTITQPLDVVLTYLDHVFTPEGNFPVSSEKFSVISQGQLLAYNNLTNTALSIPAEQNQLLADFSLSSQAETVSLQQIVVTYESEAAATTEFSLSYQGQIVSQSVVTDGQIIFVIEEPLIVKTNQDVQLSLWGNLTELGDYQFSLQDVSGQGFISGQTVKITKPLLLSQISALDNVPYFSAAQQNQNLSDGWNNLYQFQVSNPTTESLTIDKLTWQLQNFGVQVKNLELWVDNEPYQNKLSLSNNIITADFSDNSLLVVEPREILLLVKTENLAAKTRLQANLLADESADLEVSNNLLWSIAGKQYNGYHLPNFPLAPAVLSNVD